MAYNCYFSCDRCGDGWSWINQTISYNRAVKRARERGWTVGKNGWFCPSCKEAIKAERKGEKKNV